MFYKVLWSDNSTFWVLEQDISSVAVDGYWLEKHNKAKDKKNKRQRMRR